MRILIDARSVRTAAGRYVFDGLISGWHADNRVSAITAAIPRGFDRSSLPEGVEPVPLRATSWAKHILSELPQLADTSAADVVFCPNGVAPLDARTVVYFQDMFHFRLTGGAVNVAKEWSRLTLRAGWRAISSPGCRLAVCVSNEISEEVSKRVSMPVVVIPNGIDVGARHWTGERHQLFVMGGVGPRKDEQTAIRAWARIPAALRADTVLLIAGVEPESRLTRMRELIKALGVANSVTVTGSISREEYLDLMMASRVSISCSRLESFGLPVGEALAIGAPVVCSDIQSHRELTERANAGATFETRSARSLSRTLAAILRGELPPRMEDIPVNWSWAARAREHVDAYLRYP